MSVGCVNLAHVTMKFEPDEATWVLSSTDVGLAAVVGEGAFSRGLDYAIGGKVVALATADRGRVLMGTVTGNGLAPYQCLVTHKGEAANGEPLWVSRCTCPVATECKHAVAAIIAARRAITDGVSKGSVSRTPARSSAQSNVVPLFGGSSAATASWRARLSESLGPSEPERVEKRVESPTSSSWRAQLGLQFEAKARPTSMSDSTPVQRLELKPTIILRTPASSADEVNEQLAHLSPDERHHATTLRDGEARRLFVARRSLLRTELAARLGGGHRVRLR